MLMKVGAVALICIGLIVIVVESKPRNSYRKFVRRENHTTKTNSATHKHAPVAVPNGQELELVHIMFRHGIRTPADTYPNDPYINHTFTPYGWGHITNPGKEHLYETGAWLRSRYDQYLGKDYNPDLVHAQATGITRTHMTMATVLAGLFKPKNTQMEWNKNLNWQPIPIWSEDLDKDTLLLVRINCPRYYEALQEVQRGPEFQKIIKENAELFANLSRLTGSKIHDPESVSDLWSTLRAEKEYGLKLPDWTENYFPKQMQELANIAYIFNAYTDELQRIKGGPFVTKMLNEWKQKMSNELKPKGRKLFMYTGHDSTIVNVLSAMKVWKKQFPEYGIMGIFELYKNIESGERELRIYQKNEGEEPIPLTMPGCTVSCPLSKVMEILKPVLTNENLSNVCTAHDPNATTPPPTGP